MHPKIYAELLDYSQSMIRNIISDLDEKGAIQKAKKAGNNNIYPLKTGKGKVILC